MVLFLLVISILDIFLEVLIGKCTRKRPELLLSISLLLHSPSFLVLFLRPLFFSLLLQSLSASPPSFRIPSSSSFTRSLLALLPHSLSIETHSVFHRLSYLTFSSLSFFRIVSFPLLRRVSFFLFCASTFVYIFLLSWFTGMPYHIILSLSILLSLLVFPFSFSFLRFPSSSSSSLVSCFPLFPL